MAEALSDKTLVMIVGPAAVGKSTVMHAVARLDPRVGYVSAFTTRPRRDSQPTTYRHMSLEAAEAKRRTGDIHTFIIHPTTGHVYGTDSQSFTYSINLLDTLSNAVDTFKVLPFKRVLTISLTTEPEAWEEWLFGRYPTPSEERTQRLQEAARSIRWPLDQDTAHQWLVNTPGAENRTAERLLQLIEAPTTHTAPPPQAKNMLTLVDDLLSYD